MKKPSFGYYVKEAVKIVAGILLSLKLLVFNKQGVNIIMEDLKEIVIGVLASLLAGLGSYLVAYLKHMKKHLQDKDSLIKRTKIKSVS